MERLDIRTGISPLQTVGDHLIVGGDLDDVIMTGNGDDRLFGGAGADTFVFDDRQAVETTRRTVDVIHDFESGLDVIDVPGLSGTFTLVDDFTGAAFEARLVAISDTRTFLELDIDGNGARNKVIDIRGDLPLTDDLIL